MALTLVSSPVKWVSSKMVWTDRNRVASVPGTLAGGWLCPAGLNTSYKGEHVVVQERRGLDVC